MQEVIVTVDAAGEVEVEARGVVGSGCQALTKAIDSAIGTTTGDRKKPEFVQQAPFGASLFGAAQRQSQRAGQ